MTIQEVVAAVTHFAPPELQEDYDNAGLLTGRPGWECTGVLCCLDATLEVVREAAEKGCNLVLAHHPIVFRGLKSLTGRSYVEEVLIEAIKKDIAIYAAHTNLDNVIMGVNQQITQRLGLQDATVLQPKRKMLRRLITFAPHDKAEDVRQALFTAGAGLIGNYEECSFNSIGEGTFKARPGADPFVGEVGKRHQEPETKIEIVYPFYLEPQVVAALKENHPYEEVAYDIFTMENVHYGIGAGLIGALPEPMEERAFLQRLKEVFGLSVVRHTDFRGRPVQRVAVCGGSGAFLIQTARRAGADAYVTADVKYHEFFEAEGQMIVADIGHYESEQFTVDLLHDLLREKFPTFAVLKTSVHTNPVRYFS